MTHRPKSRLISNNYVSKVQYLIQWERNSPANQFDGSTATMNCLWLGMEVQCAPMPWLAIRLAD